MQLGIWVGSTSVLIVDVGSIILVNRLMVCRMVLGLCCRLLIFR